MYDNIADIAGVILIHGGTINSYETSLFNNTARTAVVGLTSCTATFSGNTTLIGNIGSFYAVASDVILEGNVQMSNGMPFYNEIIPIEEAGAITVFQSSVQFNARLQLANCLADYGGAMFISESQVFMNGYMAITGNRAREFGGGIYLQQSRFNIKGSCEVSENTAINGGGIYSISSTISLQDTTNQVDISSASTLTFISNSAKISGGAIFLSTNTKLYSLLIASSVHQVYFVKNSAQYGGALYIEDQTNFEQCNSTRMSATSSSECFFQTLALFPEQLQYVVEVQNYALNFTQNHARSTGDAIFGGLLDRCTISRLNPSRSQGAGAQGLAFLSNVSNIDATDSIASLPVRLCFCDKDIPDCSITLPPIHVKKGHMITISMVAVDQVNHTLESDITASLSSGDGGFEEGQQLQSVSANCSSLSYNVMTPHDREELILAAVGPCGNAYPSQKQIQLRFLDCSCPTGFQQSADTRTSCTCVCHSNLTNYVTCNSTSATFQRRTNSWISNITIPGSRDQFLLTHPHCPYDYCLSEKESVNINLNSLNGDNAQCAFNRSSTLCGRCLPGFSLSFGSSRCIKCGNHWPGILVGVTLLAIVFGIILVCALLFLNLTVAIGTINGVLFYANIINGNKSIYFNDLSTSSFPSIFTAWLNLDIGFDVCFYEGLDTYAKTWLQLLFPIYLIVLVVVVIVISKYSQRFANQIGKKNPVATLATLILILYAKFLSTVITILSITTLQYPDGERVLWEPDGTIMYLKDPKHAFLFVAGLAILLVGAAYTILLFSWQFLVRVPDLKVVVWIRSPKVSSFIETYHAPYTTRYRYWTGLLLFIRVLLYLITALSTSRNSQVPLVATTISVGSLLLLDTRNVYQKRSVSVLELVSLSNILIFTLITWYAIDTDDSLLHNAAAYISTTIMFVQLLIILLYHLYFYTTLHSVIRGTKMYVTFKSYKHKRRQSKEEQAQLSECKLKIQTRDVDIFELVDQDSSCEEESQQYQVSREQRKSEPTISIVEIPLSKESDTHIVQEGKDN